MAAGRLLLLALLLAPLHAHAQAEIMEIDSWGTTSTAPDTADKRTYSCDTSWHDVHRAGSRRMVGGYVVAGFAATELIITLTAALTVINDIGSFHGGWDSYALEETSLAFTPVAFGTSVLIIGASILGTGHGMQRQAETAGRSMPGTLDQVCIPSWKVDYLKGRRMVGVGTAVTVAGALMLTFGTIMDATIQRNGGVDHGDFVVPRASIFPVIYGSVALVWALPMVIAGAVKKKRALAERDGAPTSDPRISYSLAPGGLVLRW